MNILTLPKQPNTIISFWNVGALLYYSTILFFLETLFYWNRFKAAYADEAIFVSIFWLGSVIFAFSHVFMVVMDGWSRFQNYKRIKDYLFVHGFTPKIARLYKGSKCQRTAFLVAARELGMEDEVLRYYRRLGIKWYHFVPHFMIKDPFFLFKKYFWSRTFMEKHYEPKFNYRELSAGLPA
ncbi:hypothetical protein [Mucilaginibacter aquatilis]|uniref:Uncharacterized protein n=1 Tax=Mucilaginibacter aquatilis TaxID=1517760 RepID=A0A6I4IFG8_9SPHI|nr:hypothetical protein [Mucilaginibacter aquatilis]MVN92119.1 hypothetical protein [Mucilaginibacter aquatilis]